MRHEAVEKGVELVGHLAAVVAGSAFHNWQVGL
jgi:hypothetical protein